MVFKPLVESVQATKAFYEEIDDPIELNPLDMKFIADINGSLQNIILVVTVGGPHVKIDLGHAEIIGHWSSEEHTEPMNTNKADELYNYYKTFWKDQSNGGEK